MEYIVHVRKTRRKGMNMMYIFNDEFDADVTFYANDVLKAAIEAVKDRNRMGCSMSVRASKYCSADDLESMEMCQSIAGTDFARAQGMLDMFNMICGTKLIMPNVICGKFEEMC